MSNPIKFLRRRTTGMPQQPPHLLPDPPRSATPRLSTFVSPEYASQPTAYVYLPYKFQSQHLLLNAQTQSYIHHNGIVRNGHTTQPAASGITNTPLLPLKIF